MKKFLMFLISALLLLTAVSCKKEQRATIAAGALSTALTPTANTALGCETGDHTNVHLYQVFYDKLSADKKKLKEALVEGKKKGIIGAAACVFGVNMLLGATDLILSDSLLSPEMIADKCSTSHVKDKGLAWFISKCSR